MTTMTLTLTPELEHALERRAQEKGTTPELLALEGLRRLFATQTPRPSRANPPRNLAEALEGYVGVLDSAESAPGGARMSERCGEKFAAGLLEKRRQGRL